MAVIGFAVAVIIGFILAFQAHNMLQGIIVIAVSIFSGLLPLSVVMVVTDTAEEVFTIRSMMTEKRQAAEQQLCYKCKKEYDVDMRSCPHCGNKV